MSRRRYLSTEISTDPRVNKLARDYGDFAALLYTWLIPHAGDDASVPRDAEQLLLIVAPGRRDKEPEDVEAAITGMIALGLLLERDGRLQFPAASFYKHQSYIREERRGTAHTTEEARELAHLPIDSGVAAHNSAEPRTSAQNGASFSSSFTPSFSFSDSPPPPTAPEEAPAQASNRSDKVDETGEPATPVATVALEAFNATLLPFAARGYLPDAQKLRILTERYPRLDLEVEALKIAEWLREPAHRTRACSWRFVIAWLDKAEAQRRERVAAEAALRAPPATNGAAPVAVAKAPPRHPWTPPQGERTRPPKEFVPPRAGLLAAAAGE